MSLLLFFLIRGGIAFILAFVSFSLIRTNFFKEAKIGSSGRREFMLSLLIGYMAILCVFMFMPNVFIANHGIDLTSENFDFVGNFKDRINSGSWGVNIYPFRTVKSYIRYSGPFHTFINIFGNILIFMPYTFLVTAVYKKYRSILKIAGLSLGTSLFIEFVQFFIGRSVDIDDVILNIAGGILGYAVFKIFEKMKLKITMVGL